jgi:Trk-type K+ transport system membrane component
VITYGLLLVVGVAAFLIAEWHNPATLGPLGVGGKTIVGLFHGVMPRTAGFNSVDVGQLYPATLLLTDMLMFIGGGSAGTAGGIKVTTFAVLAFVIAAEVRGEPTVHVLGRRLPTSVQRQALTVALLGVGLVAVSTMTLLSLTPFRLDDVLFEVVSAFGTVGLSTGITADLPPAGQLVLTALMFLGRLGPITLASALALRDRVRRYERPEERPIVG